MELSIVKYIKTNGLEKAIKDFNLICKDYGHKVLLKYTQKDSDMSLPEVQDCRGLILEKNTWKVMSLAFRKFFNSAEPNASKIDWNTAIIFDKNDGSMIQVYFDWVTNKWCAGTTGMAEGEGEVNEKPNTSFASLFWDVYKNVYGRDSSDFIKGFTYVFELMTPYNIVVKPHETSSLSFLSARNLKTLDEVHIDILKEWSESTGIPIAKVFNLNASNAGHLISTFKNMPYTEEGYVVCDSNFNRIKIKNPDYVAMHHTKNKLGKHHILEVLKNNEIDEWIATFPERSEEIINLKNGLNKLIDDLENVWEELIPHKPKNITKVEQKKYAMKVFEVNKKYFSSNRHTGLFFGLKDGKINSVKEYITKMNNKDLYELLV